MKKTLALFLALLMLFSLGVQAASPSLDGRLGEVALKVKNTLDLDDRYTDFYGDFYDYGVRSGWQLNWTSDSDSLSVVVDENGKVMNYYRSFNDEDYRYSSEFAPSFPGDVQDQALKAAESFLSRVLDANEQVKLESQDMRPSSSLREYYFQSALYVNGVESPVTVWIDVRASDLSVSSFSRSDQYESYLGSYPSAVPAVSAEQARSLLDSTIKLSLFYVEKDGAAVLRYIPVTVSGNYFVNAQTGELVDINKLYEDAALLDYAAKESYAANSSLFGSPAEAEEAGSGRSLSQTELAGISKLEGVMTEEQLDSAVRAISELGISTDATRSAISYQFNKQTEEVFATLSYTKQADSKDLPGLTSEECARILSDYAPLAIRHTVQINAKNGELISSYTHYPYEYRELAENALSESKLKSTAEKFLAKYAPTQFAKTALTEDKENTPKCFSSLIYTRRENDIPVSGNNLYVSVDASGHISGFDKSWTEFSSFESTEGILSENQAQSCYLAGYTPTLCYVAVPVALDPNQPEFAKYISYGYTYLYEMRLAYVARFDRYISGVDARTGKLLTNSETEHQETPVYTDLEGSYAKEAILSLAQYGVGLPGTQFKPGALLTQRDMVTLFVSAGIGSSALTMDEESLYDYAFSLGILTRADKAPDKQITRLDMVKTIVNMSGYGKAAAIKGIYLVKFKDAASIADSDLGYVAIAQGLGVVRGDEKGNFRPASVATRAEGATMLFNFMSRVK